MRIHTHDLHTCVQYMRILKRSYPSGTCAILFAANSLTKTDLLYFKKGLTKHNTVHFKMTSLSEVRLRVQANWRASDRTDGRTHGKYRNYALRYNVRGVVHNGAPVRIIGNNVRIMYLRTVRACVRPSGYPQHSRIVDISCR